MLISIELFKWRTVIRPFWSWYEGRSQQCLWHHRLAYMLLRTGLTGLRDYSHRLCSSGFRSGSPSLKIAILKAVHIIDKQKQTRQAWIYDNKRDQLGGICNHALYLNKAFIWMHTIKLFYLKQFFQWLTVHNALYIYTSLLFSLLYHIWMVYSSVCLLFYYLEWLC